MSGGTTKRKECNCCSKCRTSLTDYSKCRRWSIYLIGLLETFLFGGCIFGWGQLVYVLKNEGIFSDLCENELRNDFNNGTNSTDVFDEESMKKIMQQGCKAQEKEFGLIYIIACWAYSTPAILIGLILHHFGLAISRVMASLLTGFGFLALGCTTKESPIWVYVAMVLLALGGNQLRLSVLQFCNLFPQRRSTALTIISGSFAASAGLLLTLQFGQKAGLSLWAMSFSLACVAFLSIPATIIMPWHHIPYERQELSLDEQDSKSSSRPILESVFTLSVATNIYWQFINYTGLISFAIFFNLWISEISQSNNELAGYYSMLFSLSSYICPFVSPLPGMLTDYLSRTGKDTSIEGRLRRGIQSPIIPLLIVIFLSIALQSCLFFKHSSAIYVALIMLSFIRPSIPNVSHAFIRIRFPAEHFDRLNGVTGTTTAVLNLLHYPLFLWAQKNFLMSIWIFNCLMALAAVHPLHLLSKRYMKKIINQRIPKSSKEENALL